MEALEFSAVAFIVSMVMRVMLLRVSPSMRWMKVEPRAVLIWSRREMMEVGRGDPSRLTRSLLSLSVGVFFSWLGEGLLVVGGGADGAWGVVVGVFFFFYLFATVAQVGGGTAGGGLEEEGGAGGAGIDPGLDAGVGDGGDSVAASFRT